MIRGAVVLASALALSACASGRLPLAGAPPVGDFRPLDLPQRSFATVQEMIDFYRPAPEHSGVKLDQSMGGNPNGYGDLLVLFSAEGYHDDSLAGEQWRVVLSDIPGGYRVVEAGVRYQCARGASPGEWSAALCP